jgi:hypothetical protein
VTAELQLRLHEPVDVIKFTISVSALVDKFVDGPYTFREKSLPINP